jgi:hypothetical protein
MVTAKVMRQLWAIIESTQVSTLLQFDDRALVRLLLQQLKATQGLEYTYEDSNLNNYIESKLPLIRDTAESRISIEQDNH